MMKRLLSAGLLALALTATACDDPLTVSNENEPDRERVFNNPTDLQVFVSGLFAVMLQSTTGGSNDALTPQMLVMAMENTSGLANFAMGPRGQIPRNPITNQRGSQGNAGNLHDWFRGHRAARMAALGYSAVADLSLGTSAADARARLFCRFVQGIALGNLSLAYDSASILTENDNPEADAGVVVPLSHYSAVNTAALGYLDSAIALATANPGAFPLPVTANFWLNGLATTQAQFIQIARSYKARFRANVARTPAERALVDWALVIADANAGITTDFAPMMDASNGWDVSWLAQHFASAAWHQMPQFFIAMAADSTQYTSYLSTPNESRSGILIRTRDRRFPRGASRTEQQNSTNTLLNPGTGSAGQPYTNVPYFRNRPTGSDIAGEPLNVSQYDMWRTRQLQQASRVGNFPVLTAAEIRLLAAEGYFRADNFVEMINRINVSRGRLVNLVTARDTTIVGIDTTITDVVTSVAVLDTLPNTIADTLTVIPGGASCVPKVPDPAQNYQGYKCGSVWDALRYEYRMETAFIGYGNWFFPGRGWGDLPEGTAYHWPVPYNEMDTRRQPFYGFGGVGGLSGAAPGNYGLFAGGVY